MDEKGFNKNKDLIKRMKKGRQKKIKWRNREMVNVGDKIKMEKCM